MLIAQISDLHMRPDAEPLSGELRPRDYLRTVVKTLNNYNPDIVLITGDLTDRGRADEYELVREELEPLLARCLVIPGNHDDLENFRAAFSDHDYLSQTPQMNWVIEALGHRIIGLNSAVPDEDSGHLSPESLAWLDATLAASDLPTIVSMHHPPFDTGIKGMDAIKCDNGDQLADVVARHSHVIRLLCGHVHRPMQLTWGGTMAMIAPSIMHQIALEFQPRDIPRWSKEPPAFLLHRVGSKGTMISHQAYCDVYGGALEF